ncbi:MAG: type VI secretion system accessory protein TagJ [Pseudomonadota bacterium]
MTPINNAEQSLRDGDPLTALKYLQEAVRAKPGDVKLRTFLFQLLAVTGQWERALTQLNVAAELDPTALAMAQMYGEAVRCEMLRAQVFEGKKSPMIFGQPEKWLALLIESLLLTASGKTAQAEDLRALAFEEAGASSGAIDAQPFSWIADADSRLGPVCEAIINGRYYWVPFSRLTAITIEKPEDLRDVVWMPAHFQFDNGGESVALIPSRYPSSESSEDGAIVLGRKTAWNEVSPNVYFGLGQRLITTDNKDASLMDIREITLNSVVAESAANG